MRSLHSILIASKTNPGGGGDPGSGPHLWDGLSAGGGGSDSGDGGDASASGGIDFIDLGDAGGVGEFYNGFLANESGTDLLLGGTGSDTINGNP